MGTKIRIKWHKESFLSKDDFALKYVHVIEECGQGESTVCGISYPEETVTYTKESLTCPECINVIKAMLNIAKKEKIIHATKQ